MIKPHCILPCGFIVCFYLLIYNSQRFCVKHHFFICGGSVADSVAGDLPRTAKGGCYGGYLEHVIPAFALYDLFGSHKVCNLNASEMKFGECAFYAHIEKYYCVSDASRIKSIFCYSFKLFIHNKHTFLSVDLYRIRRFFYRCRR